MWTEKAATSTSFTCKKFSITYIEKNTHTHTPDLQHSFVNVNTFAFNAELEVGCFWAVKLFPQSLGNSHEIVLI